MSELKGFLIAFLLVGLFVLPGLLDVTVQQVTLSQLQNTGAVMTQEVGSSDSKNARVNRAIALAKENRGEIVTLSNNNYKLGDTVEITIEKTVPRYFLGGDGKNKKVSSGGWTGKTETFTVKNSVVITKRDSDAR